MEKVGLKKRRNKNHRNKPKNQPWGVYIFLQIPCFLGTETIQPKLKLGKKLRREQQKCVHEMGKKFNNVKKGREEIKTFWKNIYPCQPSNH